MAARVNHWVEGLLIKPFTAGNAMAAERSDEQVLPIFVTICSVCVSMPECFSCLGQ